MRGPERERRNQLMGGMHAISCAGQFAVTSALFAASNDLTEGQYSCGGSVLVRRVSTRVEGYSCGSRHDTSTGICGIKMEASTHMKTYTTTTSSTRMHTYTYTHAWTYEYMLVYSRAHTITHTGCLPSERTKWASRLLGGQICSFGWFITILSRSIFDFMTPLC